MKSFHMNVSFFLYCIQFIYTAITTPQHPEINDQYENATVDENPKVDSNSEVDAKPKADVNPKNYETTIVDHNTTDPDENLVIQESELKPANVTESRRTELVPVPEGFATRICSIIATPFVNFIARPKVHSVLRNIGTCIVNGVMEIITHFFPAPLIPLIATAAGMVIPFEPVVLLREKMPVTSYRRAFRTALNSFLSTFDRYRLDDEADDPYMTRRFNRRLMNDDTGEQVNLKKV